MSQDSYPRFLAQQVRYFGALLPLFLLVFVLWTLFVLLGPLFGLFSCSFLASFSVLFGLFPSFCSYFGLASVLPSSPLFLLFGPFLLLYINFFFVTFWLLLPRPSIVTPYFSAEPSSRSPPPCLPFLPPFFQETFYQILVGRA